MRVLRLPSFGYGGVFGRLAAAAAMASLLGAWTGDAAARQQDASEGCAGRHTGAEPCGSRAAAGEQRPGQEWTDSERRFGSTLLEAQVLARMSADAEGERVCRPEGAYSVQCCRCIRGERLGEPGWYCTAQFSCRI